MKLGFHIISRKTPLEAAARYPDLGEHLEVWHRIAKRADWKEFMDVRKAFPRANAVGKFTVFGIKSDAYQLITEINYQTGRIFLRHVLTHGEYSQGGWE